MACQGPHCKTNLRAALWHETSDLQLGQEPCGGAAQLHRGLGVLQKSGQALVVVLPRLPQLTDLHLQEPISMQLGV